MEEEIAQLEEDVRSTSPTGGDGCRSEQAPQTPESALTPDSPSACPSSSLLPPRSPRTPITLSAVTTSSNAGLVGHSPSKMRRISQSPAPSPFRELQMDDVMSSVSDGVLLNGGGCASSTSERRRVSASRLGVSGGIHGSVEGALSIASSDVSSSVVDAVSLPPRTAVQSPAPIRAAPSEHSHLHSHLPKFHKPEPVRMTIGGGGAMLPVDASK